MIKIAFPVIIIIFAVMLNPFEQSFSESNSVGHATLPICFQSADLQANIIASELCHQLNTQSPISLLQFDRLSQQLSNQESNSEFIIKNNTKQIHQMLKQLKLYSESLQRRNVEIICELQKQRSRYKQLLAMFTFLKTSDEQRNTALQHKTAQLSEIKTSYQMEKNKKQILEAQNKALRLQSTYLKDLILIANGNYQRVELKNKQILDKYASLQQENTKRQVQMMKKTEEIKGMFAAIVIDKNNTDLKQLKGKSENIMANNIVNVNTLKSIKKEQTDEAYRSIFLKTLKGKKQNVMRQT